MMAETQTLVAQAAGDPGGTGAARSIFSATYFLIISTPPSDHTN